MVDFGALIIHDISIEHAIKLQQKIATNAFVLRRIKSE
jgi:hypothetical protein